MNPLLGLSADVESILGHEAARDATAGLSKGQRAQRQRDAARVKVTLDFSQAAGLAQAVRQAAEQERCGISSYALWLLKVGLETTQREGLTPRKRPARSLRHEYDVIFEGYDA